MDIVKDYDRLCLLISRRYGVSYDDLILTIRNRDKVNVRFDPHYEAYWFMLGLIKIFCDRAGEAFAFLDNNGSIEPLSPDLETKVQMDHNKF